jgi:hypothetical protein
MGYKTYIHRNVTMKHPVYKQTKISFFLLKQRTGRQKQILSGRLVPVEAGRI